MVSARKYNAGKKTQTEIWSPLPSSAPTYVRRRREAEYNNSGGATSMGMGQPNAALPPVSIPIPAQAKPSAGEVETEKLNARKKHEIKTQGPNMVNNLVDSLELGDNIGANPSFDATFSPGYITGADLAPGMLTDAARSFAGGKKAVDLATEVEQLTNKGVLDAVAIQGGSLGRGVSDKDVELMKSAATALNQPKISSTQARKQLKKFNEARTRILTGQ